MADNYTPPTISGYNDSPPADDGSETEANKVKWSTIKTKLADPLKTFIDAINSAVDGAVDAISPLLGETSSKVSGDSPVTVATTDNGTLFLANCTSGAITFNLPAAVTAGAGTRFSFKKTDSASNVVTIDGNASETIDGATTITLDHQYQQITVVCDGSGWHRAAAFAPGNWELIESQTASASAALDFTTGIDSTYRAYAFVLTNILPATDGAVLHIQVAEDTTPTIESGATDYEYAFQTQGSNSTSISAGNASQGDTKIIATSVVGNAAGEGIRGFVYLFGPAAQYPTFEWALTHFDTTATPLLIRNIGMGTYNGATAAILSVRHIFSAGNIASGTIELYGLRK